jgi:arsenate reductase
MEKVTIYHNNRCTKSRCALEFIGKKTKDFQVIEYLKTPPTDNELKSILKKLGMKARDLIRKKEPLFIEKFSGKKYSEDQWIKTLVKNPILIERPIIVKGNKAVIGRPTENINQIL